MRRARGEEKPISASVTYLNSFVRVKGNKVPWFPMHPDRRRNELALVDQLAQALRRYEKWLATHIMRVRYGMLPRVRRQGAPREKYKWVSPRQNEVNATREAADMADRWQKTFLRTVRALRGLRRYASPIVIQNAGQVNVANQQVNVS